MCDHRRLDDPRGARCTRDGDHADNPRGHVYKSGTGSDVPDPHTENGDDW